MPEPITVMRGKAAPLEADDVDTDQIIPAEFLKIIEKRGLGKYLFYRWRYSEDGSKKPGFALDDPKFRDASILIAGKNFGIGSSRENAVWALVDFGIRCIIASSFGDIFYNNASKNGLLCIKLPEDKVRQLRESARSGELYLTIDLPAQAITTPVGESIRFEIEPHVKERLVKGLDDIAITLSKYGEKIKKFEEGMPRFLMPRPRRFVVE
jgi:3-isopropylmalate dehydratase, small subunit (EC 4.2.1.33)